MLYMLAKIAADGARWASPVGEFLRRVALGPAAGFELELHDMIWRAISRLANWLGELVMKYWRGGGAATWYPLPT